QTAEQLREDIWRHLNDLPLMYAPEPSLWERFGKWWRRSPGLRTYLLAGAAVVLGALALGAGVVAYRQREADRVRVANGEFMRHFQMALFHLGTRPESASQREEGERQAREALSLVGMAGVREEKGELLLLLARSRLEMGDLKEARELNAQAEEVLGETAAG